MATSKTETIITYTPLVVASSETLDWLILPIKYGYIHYVNTEKKIYHIYPTDSTLVYERFEEQIFKKGDFVTFRQYTKKTKEKKKIFFKDIRVCDDFEGLIQFKSRIVVVDNINVEKQLFHFTSSLKLGSGVIYYAEKHSLK